MKFIYIQGDFTNPDEAQVNISDRAFRLGDGVFDTIRIENSKCYNLKFHLARLQLGLNALSIAYDTHTLPALLGQSIMRNNLASGFLRVSVSRGSGSKGYLPSGICKPSLVIEPVEQKPEDKTPKKLFISSYEATQFVAAKTASSLTYIMALIEAQKNGADNALILDGHDHICECASGNIFWFRDGKLHTPERKLPLIPGSVQERIFKLYNGKIIEGRFKLDELYKADEIFMTNINCIVQSFSEIVNNRRAFSATGKADEIRKLIENDINSACN